MSFPIFNRSTGETINFDTKEARDKHVSDHDLSIYQGPLRELVVIAKRSFTQSPLFQDVFGSGNPVFGSNRVNNYNRVSRRNPNFSETWSDPLFNFYTNSLAFTKNYVNSNNTGFIIPINNPKRVTDNGRIYFNEFVEGENPNTVRLAKDFKNTSDTLLGDRNIPLSNISLFYGIEDGKLKAGPLSMFKDNTTIIPVRNKNNGRIISLIKDVLDVPNYASIDSLARDNLKKKGITKPSYNFLDAIINVNSELFGFGSTDKFKRLRDYNINVLLEKNRIIENRTYPTVKRKTVKAITEQGDTIQLENINKKHKTLFSNESGISYFGNNISKLSDEYLQEINLIFKLNPVYPILVDNGRYSHFSLSPTSVSNYISPFDNPNDMYIIGE